MTEAATETRAGSGEGDLHRAVFRYVEHLHGLGNSEFRANYLATLHAAGERQKAAAPFVPLWNEAVRRLAVPAGSIAFVGNRFSSLMREVRATRPILLLATSDRHMRFAARLRIPPVFLGHLKKPLLAAYTAADATEKEARVRAALDVAARILRGARPQAIVLSQDSLFVERLIVLAARRLGIPTCVVQEGLFMEADDPGIYHGHEADLVALWGEFFRDLYRRRGDKDERDLHVIGYPHSLPPPGRGPSEPHTVCIVGQPWEAFSPATAAAKVRMIDHVLAGAPTGSKVVYRPHPNEMHARIRQRYPRLALAHPRENLEEAFARYGCFVSFTSTALFEAAIRGRVAVQVLDPAIPSDDFGRIGFAASVPNDADAIRRHLGTLHDAPVPAPHVDPDYVLLTDRPGRKLLTVLDAYVHDRQRPAR